MNATPTKLPPPPPAVVRLLERSAMPRSEDVAKRYRCIAGPYRESERGMLANCLKTLEGCRVVVAKCEQGLEVYRLRSECAETPEEQND